MPLWQVFSTEGTYSATDKKLFAEAATGVYTELGLPAFYVAVVFHDLPEGTLYIGGEPRRDFVRLLMDHVAVHAEERFRVNMLKMISKAVHPFIKDRGLSWEMHIDETPRNLWTIQGMPAPERGSDLEKIWITENRPVKLKA